MCENGKIYVCRPWNYIDKKDEKTLLLWSDIPRWLVIDDELLLLLSMFNGKNTVDIIIDNISKVSSQSLAKTEEQIKQVLPILLESNIVYEKGNEKPLPSMVKSKISDVVVHPTNRCNLNCIMCSNKSNQSAKKDEIGVEEIKRFLDEAIKFTADKASLSIVGGEPLLEADKVLEIAKYGMKIGFSVVDISTNGTLMTKEFAKAAKEIGIEVQVSIDGTNEEENDYLRGKGTFKRIIKGIEILKEEGVYVILNFLCHAGNFKSLEKYYEMALRLGVDSARFGPVKRIGAGTNEEIKNVPVDELLRGATTMFTKHPEFMKLSGRDYFSAFSNSCRLKAKHGYCGTGMATVLLNPDGNIYPCSGHALPIFRAGNILDTSFSEIWQHSPVLKKIRSVYPIDKLNEKCSSCMVRYWCLGGCRAEAYHCTHSMNSPAVECDNIKKAIIETIWVMSANPSFRRGRMHRYD